MEGANMLPVIERPSTIESDQVARRLPRGNVVTAGFYVLVGAGIAACVMGAVLVAIYNDVVPTAVGIGVIAAVGAAVLGFVAWRMGELQASRAMRRALERSMESREVAHFITNRAGAVLADNGSARMLLDGLKKDSVVTATSLAAFEHLVVPTSLPAFDRLRSHAVAGKTDGAELEISADLEPLRCWRLTFRPVDTVPELTLWTIEDLTQQKAQARLRQDEEVFLADLLDRLPVGYFSASNDGVMRYVNRTLAEWLGIAPGMGDGRQRRFADFVVRDRDDIEIESESVSVPQY